jgi:hypothetical protein
MLMAHIFERSLIEADQKFFTRLRLFSSIEIVSLVLCELQSSSNTRRLFQIQRLYHSQVCSVQYLMRSDAKSGISKV